MSGFTRESTRGLSQTGLRYDQMDIERSESQYNNQFDMSMEPSNEEPSYILCRICERPGKKVFRH